MLSLCKSLCKKLRRRVGARIRIVGLPELNELVASSLTWVFHGAVSVFKELFSIAGACRLCVIASQAAALEDDLHIILAWDCGPRRIAIGGVEVDARRWQGCRVVALHLLRRGRSMRFGAALH